MKKRVRGSNMPSPIRVICRPLAPQDNLEQVARLIYYTDDYIFPYLYNDDIATAVKVISKMIVRDTIYNYKNILIAIINDQIVGIIVYKKTPIKTDPQEMSACFTDSGIAVDDRFFKTYREYYNLLDDEPSGIYVANVCVDNSYRRMGIARQMLDFILSDDETFHLETVKTNFGALRLYQNVGFKIEYEYTGFMGVPCYRMKRPAVRTLKP